MRKRIYDFGDAAMESFDNPNVTVCTKDGKKISGFVIDVQDKNNDPDGKGYISIITDPVGKYGTWVNADNFSWAEFKD